MIGNLKAVLDEIKKERIKVYSILELFLDSARSEEELTFTGSYLFVIDFDGADFSIRLNELSHDKINLVKARQIISPFYRLYLSHSAQAGKKIKLAIGVQSEFFSMEDFQAPDLSLMSGYTKDLRDTFAYNGTYGFYGKDYGTEIAKSASIANGTIDIHVVTAGKVFIMEDYNVQSYTGAGTGQSEMIVTNPSDVSQYRIARLNMESQNQSSVVAGSFIRGLKIISGWKIKLFSSSANIYIAGFIHGREV